MKAALTVTLDVAVIVKIMEIAEKRSVTPSVVIREILDAWLEKGGKR